MFNLNGHWFWCKILNTTTQLTNVNWQIEQILITFLHHTEILQFQLTLNSCHCFSGIIESSDDEKLKLNKKMTTEKIKTFI